MEFLCSSVILFPQKRALVTGSVQRTGHLQTGFPSNFVIMELTDKCAKVNKSISWLLGIASLFLECLRQGPKFNWELNSLAWPQWGWLISSLCGLPSSSRSFWDYSHGCSSIWRWKAEAHKTLWDLGLKWALYPFQHILLVKANHKTRQD